MIENILIVDTETTGLDPNKGSKLIEIAAILYNVKHKTILQNFSTLFPCDENPVQDINGISPSSTRCRMSTGFIAPMLTEMTACSQAIVAHNAIFDKKFIEMLPFGRSLLEKRWICTKADFQWPVILPRNRLQDVCQAMGVDYVGAHRALSDCRFLAECFSKVLDLESRLNTAGRNSFSNSPKFR